MFLFVYKCKILFFEFILPADFLLSNNHVNSIIVHKFDFENEEV